MDSVVEQIRNQVIDILTDEFMSGGMDLPRLEGVIVKPGAPVDVILDTANEINADVLVLGSHSSEMHGSSLGSVPQKVLAHSRWPVYLIPQPQPLWHQQQSHHQPRAS